MLVAGVVSVLAAPAAATAPGARVADANLTPATIILPAGHYRPTIPPTGPRDNNPLIDFDLRRGALKLLRPVTIVGNGTRQTVAAGSWDYHEGFWFDGRGGTRPPGRRSRPDAPVGEDDSSR